MEIKSEEYKEYLEEKFLTETEAAELLDITKDELWQVVRRHEIPTHSVGGSFLRFKKNDIEALKNKWRIDRELFPAKTPYFSHRDVVGKVSIFERIADFWYFNDFYVLCSALIVFLVYLILTVQ